MARRIAIDSKLGVTKEHVYLATTDIRPNKCSWCGREAYVYRASPYFFEYTKYFVACTCCQNKGDEFRVDGRIVFPRRKDKKAIQKAVDSWNSINVEGE